MPLATHSSTGIRQDFDIRPLHGPLGAEVLGLDLSRPLGTSDLARVQSYQAVPSPGSMLHAQELPAKKKSRAPKPSTATWRATKTCASSTRGGQS